MGDKVRDFDFIIRVLCAFRACKLEHGPLWWRTDGEYAPVTFLVNCNDLFWWACSDCERVTEANIVEVERAFADVRAADEIETIQWASQLFVCRVRGMRPQKPALRNIPESIRPLFLACGPEREC